MSYAIPRSPQQKAVNMAEVMRRLMLAKEMNFAGDDATPAGLYMKAAVAAQSTGNTAALVDHPLVADFRDSMLPYGYFERLRASPASLKLPLQVAVAFTIASGSGALVEEMAPKPLSIEQDFDLAALDPLKVVVLFVMTRELARMSQIATALISQNGRKSVALQTDVIALSVLTSLAPSIPSTGNDAEAFLRDLASLASLIPTGVDSLLIAAVEPEQLKRLALMPDVSGQRAFADLDATRGGEVGGILFVPTSAITPDSSGSQIVLTDAAQVCIGDGPIDVRNATNATLQFETAPTNPPSASTVVRSLFQENKVATMIERFFGIRKLRANSVAVLDGVNYYSSAS